MILHDRDLRAAFYGRAALPLTETKSPLLHSARDDGDSSRYHPIYLRNTKRGGTKGRILRGTTLIHLHQINSRLFNASHPDRTYFDFSHAVQERTSLFPIYRFPAFPALCEKSEIRTFFHQHFYNMCLLYRMMRQMSSRVASRNRDPALKPSKVHFHKRTPDRRIQSGGCIIDSQSP